MQIADKTVLGKVLEQDRVPAADFLLHRAAGGLLSGGAIVQNKESYASVCCPIRLLFLLVGLVDWLAAIPFRGWAFTSSAVVVFFSVVVQCMSRVVGTAGCKKDTNQDS